MSLLNGLKNATNMTRTENGAVAYKSTKSRLLDFFDSAGSMRARSEDDILTAFNRAFSEDPLIATKMLFYFRDIRAGQGERRLFRVILKDMAYKNPDIVLKNLKYLPEFGRYDDLLCLIDTQLKNKVIAFIKDQLMKDVKKETPSLLGKWLPSLNASSKETKRFASIICFGLALTNKEYRKMLTTLRARIRIVETKITNKKYSEIDYSTVPSNANHKYLKAFWRNDEDRYSAFVNRVKVAIETEIKTGVKNTDKTAKINAKVLYPYEIVKDILNKQGCGWNGHRNTFTSKDAESLDILWKSLPKYGTDTRCNAIAVVDTSGSMTSNDNLPISAAISLGITFAEMYSGSFAGHFISFSERPELHKIEGNDITTKVMSIFNRDLVANTNIEAVFALILKTAQKMKLHPEELPDRVIIISDMQFDNCSTNSNHKALFANIKRKWEGTEYRMPNIVFWNVNAKKDARPATKDDEGVQFVSGLSPSIFTSILKDAFVTPMELMMNVIDVDRYKCIEI